MEYTKEQIQNVADTLSSINYEVEAYYNKSSGKTEIFYDITEEQKNEIMNQYPENSWVKMDAIKTIEKFELMEEFADLQEGDLQERLFSVLGGKGSFRRFRKILEQSQKALEEWYLFEANWYREKAVLFLDSIVE